MKLKITKKVKKGKADTYYQSVVEINNPNQLAFFFQDLKTLFDAPIDKAYKDFKKGKDSFW